VGESLIHLFNPLNAELNPICHLLALLGAHNIFHVSRIRVNEVVTKYNLRSGVLTVVTMNNSVF